MTNSYKDLPPYKIKSGEEFMSPNQLLHFKEKLTLWRQELIEEKDQNIIQIQDESSQIADTNDRATLEEGFAFELRARDRERKLITKINKSLHLIELGDYGYCKTCGAEISLPRLEARPTAEECIDCKTIAEKKEV